MNNKEKRLKKQEKHKNKRIMPEKQIAQKNFETKKEEQNNIQKKLLT